MAKLVAHNPQTAKLKASGYMGEPTGSIDITENGTFNVKSYAEADVNVPVPTPTLITKQITANGTYAAEDDNADGYSGVTVNVPDTSKPVLEGLIERSLTSIESDVSSCAMYAFYYYSTLLSVSFPNAEAIGGGCFRGCTSLTNVFIPNARSLGTNAFRECASLVRIELPSVTTISNNVFADCTSLSYLIFNQRASLSSTNAIPTQTIVYVNDSDLDWYSTATNWSDIFSDGRIRSIDELPQ